MAALINLLLSLLKRSSLLGQVKEQKITESKFRLRKNNDPHEEKCIKLRLLWDKFAQKKLKFQISNY